VAQLEARQFAIEIARLASGMQAEDVAVMDLRGLSGVTDFFVICSGTSDRQMRAVFDAIVEYGRKVGERPFGLDGRETATWMILDFVDVVVHIFDPPHREYYDLELLWGDAPRVEWAMSKTA
jgi:ribosome-associated protein